MLSNVVNISYDHMIMHMMHYRCELSMFREL